MTSEATHAGRPHHTKPTTTTEHENHIQLKSTSRGENSGSGGDSPTDTRTGGEEQTDSEAYYRQQQKAYDQWEQGDTRHSSMLSSDLIGQFSNSALHQITILDLSSLALSSEEIQPLKTHALETLLLNNNRLTQLYSVHGLRNLWKLDLSHNRLRSLRFLYSAPSAQGNMLAWKVFGEVSLGANQLHDIRELFRFLAITQVLHLTIQGNPFSLEQAHSDQPSAEHNLLTSQETAFLIHLLCPQVWVLNGLYISSSDRDAARAYFNSLHTNSKIKQYSKPQRNRFKALLRLVDELKLLLTKESRRSSLNYLPLGRRAREFMSLQLAAKSSSHPTRNTDSDSLDDYTKLRYLSIFHVENYLLERSLIVPEELINDASLPNGMESLDASIHIRVKPVASPSNIMHLGPPFHTALLFQLPPDALHGMRMLLKSSLMFHIHFKVNCEMYHSLLKRRGHPYSSLSDPLKNVVLQELAQLPPYARLCLIQMLGDKLLESPQRFVSNHFDVEEKHKLARFLYRKVLSTSCYEDSEVMMEMQHLFDFIGDVTRQQQDDEASAPARPSRMSIDSDYIVPSSASRMGTRSQHTKRHHIDRTPKYVLDNPEHSSGFYYSSVRVPRELELVLLNSQWTTVLEILRNGVVVLNIQNEKQEYLAVSKENMIWIPSASRGGYWKVYDSLSRKMRSTPADTKPPKKTDLALYSANDTWSSTFLVASKECIRRLNETEGDRWSSITDRIPFKIFSVPDEFVIQPAQDLQMRNASPSKLHDPPPPISIPYEMQRPQESRSSTFMTEVLNTNTDADHNESRNTPEIPEEVPAETHQGDAPYVQHEQKIHASTPNRKTLQSRSSSKNVPYIASGKSPSSSRSSFTPREGSVSLENGVTPRARKSLGGSQRMKPSSNVVASARSNKSVPGSSTMSYGRPSARANAISQGGMAVNVPNMLHTLSNRNHQLQQSTTPHLQSKAVWSIIPGKSQFVVHNPLASHPFTQKPTKKHRPIVTEPLTRIVKHDNLDKEPLLPVPPEKPFRTRYQSYRRKVWNYHRAKLKHKNLSPSKVPNSTTFEEDERYSMYGGVGSSHSSGRSYVQQAQRRTEQDNGSYFEEVEMSHSDEEQMFVPPNGS